MLPKIPYAMQKSKSQSIPMRSINLGSAAEPGELSDSLGVSTKKFPYLTTKKDDSKLDGYNGAQTMTLFNGELVTIKEDGLYVGNKMVAQIGSGEANISSGKKHFAAINSMLAIFPDKKYIQKDGETWRLSNLSATLNVEKAEFTSNSITVANTWYEIASGQGCEIDGNQFKIKLKNTIYRDAWVFFDDDVEGTTYSDRKTINALKPTDISPLNLDDGTIRIRFVENRLEFYRRGYTSQITTVLDFCQKNGISQGSIIFVKQHESNEDAQNINNAYIVSSIYTSYIVVTKQNGSQPSWNGIQTAISLYTADNGNLTKYLENENEKAVNIERQGTSEKFWLSKTTDGSFVLYSDGVKKIPSQFNQVSLISTGWDKGLTDFDIPSRILVTSQDNDNFPIIFERNVGAEITETQIVASQNISDKVIGVIPQRTTEGIVKIWGVSTGSDTSEPGLSNLKKGDTVTIEGTNSNNISFTISDIGDTTIYAASDIFTPSSETNFTIKRNIPDLNFICEKDNRLYGVNNSDKTIYVSALGDPTNMLLFEGVSTDSFAVAVGGEGDFTACCKYGDSVLFFKEDKLYKLLGSYPAEFALYSYDVTGVASGSEKSCVVINEALYYLGRDGVYVYTGGIPILISACFGERKFSSGISGTDGRYYYLSVVDDDKKPYLFAYDTRTQLWIIELKVHCSDFARMNDGLHYLSNGEVYKFEAGSTSSEWFVRWAPIYELIDGKKSYSRIVMRVSIPKHSYMQIRLRFDGGAWLNAGKIVGKNENVIPVRIPINRCDKFELELSGKGECTILDIMREYYVAEE